MTERRPIWVRSLEISKATIRKEKLQIRKNLSFEQVNEFSDRICSNLFKTEEMKFCRNLLVYADYNNEVSTEKIILTALMRGIFVYMPKVNGDEMDFYRVFSLDELQSGAYGIREPYEIEHLKYVEEKNSVCLLPLSAFDASGNRIGYGKGYYDKYLNRVKVDSCIGLAFSFQESEDIPADVFDRKLDKVVTEEKVFDFHNI